MSTVTASRSEPWIAARSKAEGAYALQVGHHGGHLLAKLILHGDYRLLRRPIDARASARLYGRRVAAHRLVGHAHIQRYGLPALLCGVLIVCEEIVVALREDAPEGRAGAEVEELLASVALDEVVRSLAKGGEVRVIDMRNIGSANAEAEMDVRKWAGRWESDGWRRRNDRGASA